jgi:hypothetical protein
MKLFAKFSLSSLLIASLQPLTSHASTKSVQVDGLYSAAKSSADDGRLTREELKRYPKLAAIVNKQLSKNFVTKAEVEALYRSHRANNIAGFKSLDANHDGKLAYSEVVFRAPGIAKAFTFLDQGRKGYLVQSDFFQPRVVINFKSAAPARKSMLVDPDNTDLNNTTDAILTPNSMSSVALDNMMPLANESTNEALPEGVMNWDQWVAAEALRPEGFNRNSLAKDECEADQCMDEIVVICGSDCGTGGGGGGDHIDISPIVVMVDEREEDFGLSAERVAEIIQKIAKNACVKKGDDCGVFSQGILRDCTLETRLSPAMSTPCRLLANDLLVACTQGQVPSCP